MMRPKFCFYIFLALLSFFMSIAKESSVLEELLPLSDEYHPHEHPWLKFIYKEFSNQKDPSTCGLLCLLDSGPCHFFTVLNGSCFLGRTFINNDYLNGVQEEVDIWSRNKKLANSLQFIFGLRHEKKFHGIKLTHFPNVTKERICISICHLSPDCALSYLTSKGDRCLTVNFNSEHQNNKIRPKSYILKQPLVSDVNATFFGIKIAASSWILCEWNYCYFGNITTVANSLKNKQMLIRTKFIWTFWTNRFRCSVAEKETTKVICGYGNGTLDCSKGVIKVLSANYGRTDTTTCPHHSAQTTSCYSNQLSYVKSQCEDKISCTIKTDATMGDPCLYIRKYLDVRYYCLAPGSPPSCFANEDSKPVKKQEKQPKPVSHPVTHPVTHPATHPVTLPVSMITEPPVTPAPFLSSQFCVDSVCYGFATGWFPMDITVFESGNFLAPALIECPPRFVLTGFTFEQNEQVDKFRYVFNCIDSQIEGVRETFGSVGSSWLRNNRIPIKSGNIQLLSNQTIDCLDQGILNFFQLELNNAAQTWKYKFGCVKPNRAITRSCNTRQTRLRGAENFRINALRQLPVNCEDNEHLNSVVLTHNLRLTSGILRYIYTCCRFT